MGSRGFVPGPESLEDDATHADLRGEPADPDLHRGIPLRVPDVHGGLVGPPRINTHEGLLAYAPHFENRASQGARPRAQPVAAARNRRDLEGGVLASNLDLEALGRAARLQRLWAGAGRGCRQEEQEQADCQGGDGQPGGPQVRCPAMTTDTPEPASVDPASINPGAPGAPDAPDAVTPVVHALLVCDAVEPTEDGGVSIQNVIEVLPADKVPGEVGPLTFVAFVRNLPAGPGDAAFLLRSPDGKSSSGTGRIPIKMDIPVGLQDRQLALHVTIPVLPVGTAGWYELYFEWQGTPLAANRFVVGLRS
jgi:hypothetical protein